MGKRLIDGWAKSKREYCLNKNGFSRGSYVGSHARVIKFYGDVKVGTIGIIEKHWIDGKKGIEWMRLSFGNNLSGQKLEKSFPSDVLELCSKKTKHKGRVKGSKNKRHKEPTVVIRVKKKNLSLHKEIG